jgi:tetratricopeptide (TPR) repeat protein
MARSLSRRQLHFHRAQPKPGQYRLLLWAFLILGAVWILLQVNRGQIQSPFSPTPTPTRAAQSFILEAQAYFDAGKLDDPASDRDAIDTYRKALEVDPNDPLVLAELARIQAYSSLFLSTDKERLARLEDARDNVLQASELAPDDSTVLALKAFVLDWNASSNLITSDEREAYLADAEAAASRAYLLDPENAIALAFYAEVLLDQQKWDQALGYAEQAVNKAPEVMDTHRVYATVLEYVGAYRDAIEEYERASSINPNLTFLLLNIGLGYRNLAQRTPSEVQAGALYTSALEYFDRAANINKQLGIQDPTPYIAIAKTYTQQGEFFIASRNAETALRLSPTSANTYGQLGMIYVAARNYESALEVFRCAIEGCLAAENQLTLRYVEEKLLTQSYDVEPLDLTNLEVAYYYIRYGSVLAYLHEPENNYCQKTQELMNKLRDFRSEDALLMENVAENEAICASIMGESSP